ncbi:GntR family transcriptional regulator [Nocardia nova]|uniref:GntR family transcriptional regulator n=1 Tax=Nocardia nova TaxID=37330 RepID=UPI00340F7122
MTSPHNLKLPLWYQMAQSLRADIMRRASNDLRLAPEAELAEQYGVSAITARQALKALEQDGLITRRRGRGTFINPERLSERSLQLMGSLDAVVAQQTSEMTDVLEFSKTRIPALYESDFGTEAPVMMFCRLRRDAGEPVSHAINYVAEPYGCRIVPDNLRHASMTQILRDDLNVPIRRIEDTVAAKLPTPEIAEHLDIELTTPILQLTGRTYDDTGQLIDLACISYRADRYEFGVRFDISTG